MRVPWTATPRNLPPALCIAAPRYAPPDTPEHLERPRAVHDGGLEGLARQAHQAGQHDEGDEGRPLPDIDRHDRRQHEPGIGQQGGADIEQADQAQVIAHHAEIALQQQLPDQADRDRREHHRHQQQGDHETSVLDRVEQQQREREADQELQADDPENELEGEQEAVPKDRIVAHQAAEVVEADKVAVAPGDREAEIGEAGPDHIKKRPDQNEQQQDHGGQQEEGDDPSIQNRPRNPPGAHMSPLAPLSSVDASLPDT